MTLLDRLFAETENYGLHEDVRALLREAAEALTPALEGPVAWRYRDASQLGDPDWRYLDLPPLNSYAEVVPLYVAPAQQVVDDAKDAARWRFLRPNLVGADFAWNSPPIPVLIFEFHGRVSADADATIDAAIAALQPAPAEQGDCDGRCCNE